MGIVLTMEWHLKNMEDWERVAAAIAPKLTPGSILGLTGPLGAGKTTFVQALAKKLGASSIPKSPTFSLLRTYPLRPTRLPAYQPTRLPAPPTRLIHVDAYRLEKPADLLPLNLEEELAEPGTVLVIEWAERVAEWLKRRTGRVLMLTIEHKTDGGRTVRLEG